MNVEFVADPISTDFGFQLNFTVVPVTSLLSTFCFRQRQTHRHGEKMIDTDCITQINVGETRHALLLSNNLYKKEITESFK